MSFEWFVAKRYLRSPNRPAVLRLVTAFNTKEADVAAFIAAARRHAATANERVA